MKHTV